MITTSTYPVSPCVYVFLQSQGDLLEVPQTDALTGDVQPTAQTRCHPPFSLCVTTCFSPCRYKVTSWRNPGIARHWYQWGLARHTCNHTPPPTLLTLMFEPGAAPPVRLPGPSLPGCPLRQVYLGRWWRCHTRYQVPLARHLRGTSPPPATAGGPCRGQVNCGMFGSIGDDR